VFLAIIQDADRYDPSRAAVIPWLLGIARNHVRRWADRSRRTISLDEGAELVGSLASEGSPSADLEQRDEVAAVRRALIALPVKYREAIVLCDLRELSYADAALVLKCAIGTVRSRLHRGRALLARRIAEAERAVFQTPATRVIL
jgi:RNA polymerase sigma-70 factor, ECF subfamily